MSQLCSGWLFLGKKEKSEHQCLGGNADKVQNCLPKMPNRKVYISLHAHSQGRVGNKKNKTKDETQEITTFRKYIYTQMAVGWFPDILV